MISSMKLRSLSGAGPQSLSGAGPRSLSGAGPRSLSGAGPWSLSGAEARSLSGAEGIGAHQPEADVVQLLHRLRVWREVRNWPFCPALAILPSMYS